MATTAILYPDYEPGEGNSPREYPKPEEQTMYGFMFLNYMLFVGFMTLVVILWYWVMP